MPKSAPASPVIAAVAAAVLGTMPASAMIGGTAAGAPLSAATVMVLSHQGKTAGFCTGVVLAPDVVLTAAHCVPKGSDVRVHLPGSGGTPIMLPVRGIAINPDYRARAIQARERSIDLALVRLQAPLPDSYAASRLARTAGTTAGARFVATGFGVAQEGEAATSGTLRSVSLAARAPLSGVLLWAEDPDKGSAGACTGDSGGPVTADGSPDVAAVMVWSAGAGGRACGSLTQAVWLAPQKPWLDRVLQAWRPPATNP